MYYPDIYYPIHHTAKSPSDHKAQYIAKSSAENPRNLPDSVIYHILLDEFPRVE